MTRTKISPARTGLGFGLALWAGLALGVPAAAQTAAAPATTASPAAVQTAPQGSAPAPVAAAPAAPSPAAGPSVATAVPAATPPANAVVTDDQAAASAAKPAPPPLIAPTPGIGMPGTGMGLQTQVTDVGQDAEWLHDVVLMPIITLISLFVLGLLLWVIVRYRRSANPIPSRTSHNTTIEVIWTLVPVIMLVLIAVPSIKLLARQYAPPKADLTVKVIGNQWYWTYQYPDNGDFEVVSNMLKEPGDPSIAKGARARTDADGPRLLAVDERMVVPAGAVVKLILTSNDVIHSFAVPAFWTKMDAVPGRLNETWFKVDKPGVYFGQCSELCGARHAFMPIAVEVLPRDQFAAWVASKGGTMAGAKGPDATSAASPATAAPAAAGSPQAVGVTGAPSDATENATAAPTPTTQGATANEGTQKQ